MSTWTSRAAVLPAALALSGCLTTGAVQRAGGIAVAAPVGLCPAPAARAGAAGGDFLAFAPCDGAAAPVLTATVGAEGSAAGVDLSGPAVAAFVRSPPGRAALSRVGKADSVIVEEVLRSGDVLLIRLVDRAPGPGGLPPGEAWRALLARNGRLVTLTLAGAGPRDAGLSLILQALGALDAANPG